jgi:hypothetical protein
VEEGNIKVSVRHGELQTLALRGGSMGGLLCYENAIQSMNQLDDSLIM